MARSVLVALGAAALLVAAVAGQTAVQCGDCDRADCPELGKCPTGVVKDFCGCCDVCAGRMGDRCQNSTEEAPVYLPCGTDLVCKKRHDVPDSVEASCECNEDGEVCGSNGVTYRTPCHLVEEMSEIPELFVKERGPCRGAPKIKSPPKDAVRPYGGIMVMDCEASGYPVPTITWELYQSDRNVITLPSDDSAIAVQVRGGPEKHMVTGWVQIMRVNKNNIGTYTCVASNSEGEARATAGVTLLADDEEEISKNDL